jgi:hypothetical protein
MNTDTDTVILEVNHRYKNLQSTNPESFFEFKELLSKQLSENVLEITFTKLDGTERVLNCTLDSNIVPQSTNEETKSRKPNDAIMSVWDLENNDWRSFRIENVVRVKWSR